MAAATHSGYNGYCQILYMAYSISYMASKPTGNPIGRPTKYTQQLAQEICDLHRSGVSIKEIADMDGMPNQSSIYLWASDIAEFSEVLDRARLDFIHIKMDRLLPMLEERGRDGYVDNHGRRDLIAIKRDELIAGHTRWLAERRLRRYSNKTEITGAEGTPLIPVINITVDK